MRLALASQLPGTGVVEQLQRLSMFPLLGLTGCQTAVYVMHDRFALEVVLVYTAGTSNQIPEHGFCFLGRSPPQCSQCDQMAPFEELLLLVLLQSLQHRLELLYHLVQLLSFAASQVQLGQMDQADRLNCL